MSRNIALIILDCVRKDYFEEFAYRLSSLADVSFDRCYAASSWSTPSHASILTGDLPHQHGVHAYNLEFDTLSKSDTFLNDLPDHRTVGTSTNLFAGPAFGFDTLFDEFPSVSRNGLVGGGINIERFHQNSDKRGVERYTEFLKEAYNQGELQESLLNGLAVKSNELIKPLPLRRLWDYGGKAMISSAEQRLLKNDDEPFFFFANFMEAHSPYEPCRVYDDSIVSVSGNWSDPIDVWDLNAKETDTEGQENDLQSRREIYAGSIDYLDRILAPFIRKLVNETHKETTVVVTADHGERLALPEENGVWGHAGGMSTSLLHVPMLVVNPPSNYDPDTNSRFSHLDLGTLLADFGQGEQSVFDRDLIPAERIGLGVAEDIDPANFEFWNRSVRSVYEGETRFEWDSLGNHSAFKHLSPSTEKPLEKDFTLSEEQRDLFDVELNEYKRKAQQTKADLDEATKEGLEALGYL